jgi:hypothetical protein
VAGTCALELDNSCWNLDYTASRVADFHSLVPCRFALAIVRIKTAAADLRELRSCSASS